MHTAYKQLGGNYDGNGVVEAVTKAAAATWNEHKDRIRSLAMDAAVTFATELIRELIRVEGQFPP